MKVIVDGNNLGFMAHYSTGELSVQDMRTGVIFGFLRMIFAIAKRFETNQFIFVWDSRKSFRIRDRKEYKQHRRDKVLTPEEEEELCIIRDQFKELRKYVLPTLGFRNIFKLRGYEGDDLIARIVKQYKEEMFCIVSTDKDLYQLLRPRVFMYNQMKKERTTSRWFESTYKLKPKKWAKAKAIGGCDGDNVKGIYGASDPAKSPSSKAIKFVKGELTSGVIKDRIESNEGQKIVKENLKLVKLPYKGNGKFDICLQKDKKFKKKNWIKVFDYYDFRFFLMREQLDILEEIFRLR